MLLTRRPKSHKVQNFLACSWKLSYSSLTVLEQFICISLKACGRDMTACPTGIISRNKLLYIMGKMYWNGQNVLTFAKGCVTAEGWVRCFAPMGVRCWSRNKLGAAKLQTQTHCASGPVSQLKAFIQSLLADRRLIQSLSFIFYLFFFSSVAEGSGVKPLLPCSCSSPGHPGATQASIHSTGWRSPGNCTVSCLFYSLSAGTISPVSNNFLF